MTNKTDEPTTEETKQNTSCKLGDDLIAVVRELIQLSLLTGTNIVDHMRAVRVEVIEDTVVPTEEYIAAYNAQVEELARRANEEAEAMQASLAEDSPVN